MGERAAPGAGPGVRRDAPADARAMCVWLGTLASWRPGLIGRLVREYRCTASLLERPPAEIVAFALRRTKARGGRVSPAAPRTPDGSASRRHSEELSEAQRFAAVLREGPEACLRRAERRPRGDLVVAWSEALYPDQLRDLDDPPLCLFVRGGAGAETVRARVSALVDVPLVGVVGTRTPSPYGEEMARTLGGDLARAGVVVVSGLAMGIDAIAQTAAVEVDTPMRPRTVAVLGCGADWWHYPPARTCACTVRSRSRASSSASSPGASGACLAVSARNRVMAGSGLGVVLVEGAVRGGPDHRGVRRRSGTRRPVRTRRGGTQAERGAEPAAARRGAGLRERRRRPADHRRLRPWSGAESRAVGSASSQSRHALVLDHGGGAIRDVLHALGAAALTVDELSRRCRIPAPKVAAAVSELEVEGLARRVEGGRYRLIRA